MGRSLPNYTEYLHKIKLYLRICGIKLVRREVATEAAWIPSRREISVDWDLDESTEIACILHEIGHSLDDALRRQEKLHDKAYTAFYAGKATRRGRLVVKACEIRAWNNAEAIARTLQIPCGRWFKHERRRLLKTYSSSTS